MRDLLSGFRARLVTYLPEYLNGTLGTSRVWILERWLARDQALVQEMQRLEKLRSLIGEQSQQTPDPSILTKITAAAHAATKEPKESWRPSLVWVPIIGLLIAAGILLWQVLPPGLVVQWSVRGEIPTTFRVYRAPGASADAEDFTLIGELTSEPGVENYGFTDLLIVPGQQFSYRVEGFNPSGRLASSQEMVGNSLDAVPGQLMILMLVAAGSMGIVSFYRQLSSRKQARGRIALL